MPEGPGIPHPRDPTGSIRREVQRFGWTVGQTEAPLSPQDLEEEATGTRMEALV